MIDTMIGVHSALKTNTLTLSGGILDCNESYCAQYQDCAQSMHERLWWYRYTNTCSQSIENVLYKENMLHVWTL